jgi:metal-responsive CopG/Arc/MetJ family transcriptional regulator
MSLMSLRLPGHLVQELDRLASERRTTRSDIVREAAEQYCASQRAQGGTDRLALLNRLIDYKGSGRGNLARNAELYLRAAFDERRRHRSR